MTNFVSIILPCYNEGNILEENLNRIAEILNHTIYTYELILIDDSSSDNTPGIIKEFAHGKNNVQCIFHKTNIGRGGTVSEGIKLAKGNIVGFLDVDLEVDAIYIPAMLIQIEQRADVALGRRTYLIGLNIKNFIRHILSIGYKSLIKYCFSLPCHDTEVGYKFFKKDRIMPTLDKTAAKGWFWDTEIMVRSHYSKLKIVEVPCLYIRRFDKKSTVKPIRDSINYIINLIKFKNKLKYESL